MPGDHIKCHTILQVSAKGPMHSKKFDFGKSEKSL
ncbi:hypothetical protein BN2476_1640006 [Paraburkholderia piptadeniae]|uniref:Uncharacterized protein n=1 Tax=Paraburkholderia piptadeniae TaxID=1701573 RepID=A0A1N7SX36_9BURK|nr:hypothetical protein BN2476_1640006 [Paraburkholderia piptadeniae]